MSKWNWDRLALIAVIFAGAGFAVARTEAAHYEPQPAAPVVQAPPTRPIVTMVSYGGGDRTGAWIASSDGMVTYCSNTPDADANTAPTCTKVAVITVSK